MIKDGTNVMHFGNIYRLTIYVYVYVCMYICVCVYIYIHIYIRGISKQIKIHLLMHTVNFE
jgi:hypothetical protein